MSRSRERRGASEAGSVVRRSAVTGGTAGARTLRPEAARSATRVVCEGAMTAAPLEALELLVNVERLAPRLDAAAAALAQLPGLADEKTWLDAARQRLAGARRDDDGALILRALRLPELEPARRERARHLQGAIVDALERLQAGIAYAGGSGAPLLDLLYGAVKLPPLRRCAREALERFCVDFEKRMSSTYAKRMFATDTYEVVAPAVNELRAAIATWRSVFIAAPPDETEAMALRRELDVAARRLELPFRQARLLAQAALLPTAELLDETGLTPEAKRRGKDPDTHALLENDPPDPHLPTDEERAEFGALMERSQED